MSPHPTGGTFILVPDGEDTEDESAEGGSEEATPVVADGEEGGGDLDAEEDAWHRGEAHEGGGETQAGPPVPGMLPTLSPRSCTAHRGLASTTDTLWGGVKGFPGKAHGWSPAGGSRHGGAGVSASKRVARGREQETWWVALGWGTHTDGRADGGGSTAGRGQGKS